MSWDILSRHFVFAIFGPRRFVCRYFVLKPNKITGTIFYFNIRLPLRRRFISLLRRRSHCEECAWRSSGSFSFGLALNDKTLNTIFLTQDLSEVSKNATKHYRLSIVLYLILPELTHLFGEQFRELSALSSDNTLRKHRCVYAIWQDGSSLCVVVVLYQILIF